MRKVSNILQLPKGVEMPIGLPGSPSDWTDTDWDEFLRNKDEISKFLFGPSEGMD